MIHPAGLGVFGIPDLIHNGKRVLIPGIHMIIEAHRRADRIQGLTDLLQGNPQLLADLGKEPTLPQISKELGVSLEEVSQALDAVCSPVSLYDHVYSGDEDPLTIMDQVRDNKNTEASWMDHIALKNAFLKLQPREKQILSLRFYDCRTQMEVAKQLGISLAQVSRLEKGAIEGLR